MSTPSISLPWGRVRDRVRARTLARPRPELALLLVLAAVLNLWALDRNGFANEYYSAAVRSMTSSWHAFLYESFDPAGVMTVDKPPLSLWIQSLSAKLFGFGSWSLLVPQALMGVGTVWLTYDLVGRRFGRAAAFASGLVLALTPIMVAISRHNNPDALLVLCCTAAVWSAVRGLEDGRTRWLVLSGVLVGLGFEAKMLVAFMVVPGIAAAWLFVAPRGRVAAVRQLLAGAGAMAVVGLAWPVLMWLTPASSRPWISGTSDNSIWSLIFGYNGLGRIAGQSGGPGGGGLGPSRARFAGGGPGGFFGGDAGPLRLLNQALGGQDGWLLGFALVAGVALVFATRLRRADARTGWLIAVAGAFVTTAVAFSEAQGIFHPYYVSLLAPFTAALVGGGAAVLAARGRSARLLAPAAIAAGVVTELVVLHENPGQLQWLAPVLVVGGLAAAAVLALQTRASARAAALCAALGALLVAPGAWAVETLGHPTSGTFPAGGPETAGFGGGPGGRVAGARVPFRPGALPPGAMPRVLNAPPPGGLPGIAPGGARPPGALGGRVRMLGGGPFGGNDPALKRAFAYARSHGGGTVVVSSQSGAAGQLIMSGAKVAAIGGFSGRESQVSIAWLAGAIDRGQIRWVLTDDARFGGLRFDTRVGARDAMTAVSKSCAKTSISGLYDCRGRAGALRGAL
jgi:4-amino-4-deoxy-L-arabinose transferase-like glycosyltransferase